VHSAVPLPEGMIRPLSLLSACGWSSKHLWIGDVQTGEGALFQPGGSPQADLEKHRMFTCPLFPHFLAWLYEQDFTDLAALPSYVELPDAPFKFAGQRGAGPRRSPTRHEAP
jgi:hypothetical protein